VPAAAIGLLGPHGISIARTTQRNVKRWRDGEMAMRWTAAGMHNAEQRFRRIKGYKDMPLLLAVDRHTTPSNSAQADSVAVTA